MPHRAIRAGSPEDKADTRTQRMRTFIADLAKEVQLARQRRELHTEEQMASFINEHLWALTALIEREIADVAAYNARREPLHAYERALHEGVLVRQVGDTWIDYMRPIYVRPILARDRGLYGLLGPLHIHCLFVDPDTGQQMRSTVIVADEVALYYNQREVWHLVEVALEQLAAYVTRLTGREVRLGILEEAKEGLIAEIESWQHVGPGADEGLG